MNRRSFLQSLGVGLLSPVLVKLAPITSPYYGTINLTLSEIVNQTLRANMGKLAANITANNALFYELNKK